MDNQMENQQERTISIQELWRVFVKNILLIVLAAAVVGGGYLLISKITYTPMYTSTASVVVVREQENTSTSASTVNDFNVASKVLPNFAYMATEKSMLDAVIDELTAEGKLTSELTDVQLRKRIEIDNPSNTHIVNVTVEAETAQQAKYLADRITEKTMEKMNEVFLGVESTDALVRMYHAGLLSTKPSNGVKLTTAFIAAVVAAMLTYGVLCLIYLFDDAIRTKDDVIQYLGVSVLGEIPDAGDIHSYEKYGYGRYGYGRSGYEHPSEKGEKS